MLKQFSRRFGSYPPTRFIDEYGEYISKEQVLLHKRFQKVKTDRTKIDFENVPELFTQTRKDQDTLRNL